MISIIDAIDEVIGILYDAPIANVITGEIGTDRPLNSTKEDVTVNALPLSGSQLQRAVINVNLHVPNLKRSLGSGVDSYIVNRPRFRELVTLVQEALNERVTGLIYTTIQNSQLIKEEHSSYINFRVEIKGKNL